MDAKTKDKILKPREFKTREDIAGWFRELLDAGVNFHPEDSGEGLIDLETDKPTFSDAEAKRYDSLMEEATEACRQAFRDVCEVACEAWEQWAADNGLSHDVQKRVEAKIPDRPTLLQRLVRAVCWHMVSPNTADHSGYDKREAIAGLCNAVGLEPPEFEEDEEE